MQTTLGRGYVYAALTDWPADDTEQQVLNTDTRAAVEGAALHLD